MKNRETHKQVVKNEILLTLFKDQLEIVPTFGIVSLRQGALSECNDESFLEQEEAGN
jgi:hypothetical protein